METVVTIKDVDQEFAEDVLGQPFDEVMNLALSLHVVERSSLMFTSLERIRTVIAVLESLNRGLKLTLGEIRFHNDEVAVQKKGLICRLCKGINVALGEYGATEVEIESRSVKELKVSIHTGGSKFAA